MHPRQIISLKPHPFSTSLDESLSFSATAVPIPTRVVRHILGYSPDEGSPITSRRPVPSRLVLRMTAYGHVLRPGPGLGAAFWHPPLELFEVRMGGLEPL